MIDEKNAIQKTTARGDLALSLILILSDGIRGHINQSRGVANWLSRESGAEVVEVEIPQLAGRARIESRRAAKRLLVDGSRRMARDWLVLSDASAFVREVGALITSRGIREGDDDKLLIISAGTSAALFNIALGYLWRCTCATLMTPSAIGTDPFDFAIVPEHDFPDEASNILITLGAPSLIVREELAAPAADLLRVHPPQHDRRWGVLIGGDDRNYIIDEEWIKSRVGGLMAAAEREGADLYITTSRRTSREAEDTLKRSASRCANVRFLLLASEDQRNPVPAMLGACDEVFVTDDSVNMVSEAITAGHCAVLMRATRRRGLSPALARLVARLADRGVISPRRVFGAPRFDATFERFKDLGLAVELEARLANGPLARSTAPDDFNEARRAAEWIIDGMRA